MVLSVANPPGSSIADRSDDELPDLEHLHSGPDHRGVLHEEEQEDEDSPSENEIARDMDYEDEDEEDDEDDDIDAHDVADDYNEVAPTSRRGQRMSKNTSPSRHTARGVKRKASVEDDEYIRNNPSLYGLRRSSRAHVTRPINYMTSDSDSGETTLTTSRKKRGANRNAKQPRQQPGASRNNLGYDSSSNSDDDDADELYGPSSRSSKTKRGKRPSKRTATRGGDSADIDHYGGALRFSTRQANKVTNYAEDGDDEEDFLEEDDDAVGYTYDYAPQVDESIPAIDVVLNHRLREGVDVNKPDLNRHDYEFYIKWQEQSHYHSSWETTESVAGCRSVRRLDNYIRKVLSIEISFTTEPNVALEDKEKWQLDRERDTDAIEDFKKVERVIGTRKVDGVSQYYVKWKRLFYDSCTWEDASLVSQIAQNEIDRYLDRCSHFPVSDKTETNVNTRSSFEPIHGTPSFLKNGELKEFQVKGVNFLAYNWVRGRNVILADEMGLGKTVQTVAFMNWLRHVRHQQGPFIVVVPLSTMPSWAETFDNWTPDMNYVVYNGNEGSRSIIRDYELFHEGNIKKPKFHALLTTYEYVLVDSPLLSQIKWQFMGVDEAHRLKNRDSQLYAKMNEFRAPSRLLITGTPVQNNLGELAALMDFLNPGVVDIDENMDLDSKAASIKLHQLTQSIQPFMLRRTKSKVESDLPPKTDKIIRVELSDFQLEYYRNILTKNYAALNEGSQKQSLLNIMMELKKASNHPFMFPNAEAKLLAGKTGRQEITRALITSSGKMMLLDQLLTKLKRDGHRVLIFSQMVHMLDILADYMDYRGYAYQRLDGTIAASSRRISIEHFNAPQSSDFAFLLSTRAGGLGINLMTADTVVLFDSDWNPQADLQAMARAHRIGQTKPVSVYRLVSKDTVEEEVLERARNKLLLEFITIQHGVTDKEATELKDKMARAGHIYEPSSSDDISRILKRRGQRMFEQSGNQKKLEELDIDSVLANAEEHKAEQPESMEVNGGEEFLKAFEVVDVALDWDEIIPKEQLDKVKAEEEEQRHLESLQQEQSKSREEREDSSPDSSAATAAAIAAADTDNRAERRAKRRARAHVTVEASNSDDEEPPDPNRPLREQEYRHLVRAYLRYGNIDEHRDALLREARLVGRNIEVVKAGLEEILARSRALVNEESERLKVIESEGRAITKKDRKTILFDHKGVKRINAETMLERPHDMHLLRKAVDALSNSLSFRIPEATKGTDYTCNWGAREDGMLCVGVARHGFGAWTQIRDDPDLHLQDKFFLEEHRVDRKAEREREQQMTAASLKTKSPGAVHLVRRMDYLLSVLRDKMSNGTSATTRKASDNQHRNNRKSTLQHQKSMSASPVPPSTSKRERAREREGDGDRDDKPGHRSTRDSRDTHSHPRSTSNNQRRAVSDSAGRARAKHSPRGDGLVSNNTKHRAPSYQHGQTRDTNGHRDRSKQSVGKGHENSDDDQALMAGIFRPQQRLLEKLSKLNKEHTPDKKERLLKIRKSLEDVGTFITDITRKYPKDRSEWLETQLWNYVTEYWPNPGTPGDALHTMYNKMVDSQKETNAPSSQSSKTKTR